MPLDIFRFRNIPEEYHRVDCPGTDLPFLHIQALQAVAQLLVGFMGNLLTVLLEVIENGVDNLPVSQEEMRILQGTALEEIGPCHMVLEQEDAVIVSVIDAAILFQESETPLEIRDFSTIGTHWGLAENGDANQPEYHYKKQLPQNQKILLLT